MNIKFVSELKSLKPFRELEIGNFCIFTGKNGSGKTHILQAIKQTAIKIDDIRQNEILYLNYFDFAHNFQTTATTESSIKVNAWNRLKKCK